MKKNIRTMDFLFGAVTRLVEDSEPRTSGRQLLAFLAVAQAEADGKSITLSDIRDMEGSRGQIIIGQSIAQTFAMLLDPSDREPRGLGWVRQEVDPSDNRRKYLKLTDKGRALLESIGGM
ncbi:hypothetical protein [Brevundimonas nasdae]|uniref:Uncharacterized protein n=1 Tax=Brevundimonas nasdae TaxID=172043 RepID=A0ACD4VQL8_9CAUL|nr:hypothetical protein [Brevundimonas nasdae]WOB78465.1 hypothetical protein PZA08_14350 [Brevundimonas nasdae]